MKVRYIASADPTDDTICEVFGISFAKDEWVDVDADTGETLTGNPTFEVEAPKGKPKG